MSSKVSSDLCYGFAACCDIQPQGHVQVLVNIIDLGMGLQQAINAPRYRYMSGRGVLLEDEIAATVIDRLIARATCGPHLPAY